MKTINFPFALWAYTAFAYIASPFWRLFLWLRLRKGREDGARLSEKFGRYDVSRPAGTLIWFHAVSVGESLAVLTTFRRVLAERPDLHIVLTTSTVASVAALDKAGLPDRVIHQYAPIDTPGPVRRFLAHWRPDACVIVEADMWPITLKRTHATGIPMMMLNTTVTPQRYRERLPLRHSYGHLFGFFRWMLLQDEASVERFVELGATRDQMVVMGSLKSTSDQLPDAPEMRAQIEQSLANRPRWTAAVTRHDEDVEMLETHLKICESLPDCVMIIAPRQVWQGDEIEAQARARFTHVARRSAGDPITAQTQVYIADTIGEMGLWYRIAPVAFLGHSFADDGREMSGKNPFEALMLGAVVLHGPTVQHFAETYEQLDAQGVTQMVRTQSDLAQAVLDLQAPEMRAGRVQAFESLRAQTSRPLDMAVAYTLKLVDPTR